MNENRSFLEIEGYASRFYVRDLAGDMVLPGAFVGSLSGRKANRIRMLFQHDTSELIGVWDEIIEDQTGLFVRGRLFADGPRGRTAMALVKRGSVDGLSIGFRTKNARKAGNGRDLYEIDLWEVSIVTFPMLPTARLHLATANHPATAGLLSLYQAG
ncbi:MAG: HK97 family phage prohead protease [Robiginitomaculum sp.]|nr:HK97 family phage prohead protease [Robiginitomaculum sp.]